jgi:nickel-dependent lactate racemase
MGVIMSILVSKGGTDFYTTDIELLRYVKRTIEETKIDAKKILIIPPDTARLISQAGKITRYIYNLLKNQAKIEILPALGSRSPMTEKQIREMFGNEIPLDCFITHDLKSDTIKKGTIDSLTINKLSEGKLNFDIDIEINKKLFDGYDLIFSIGQVAPHEVTGMDNYTKNIMLGIGGSDIINKSHFLGATYNIEKMLGKPDTPVRALLNLGAKKVLNNLPIFYILTCIDQDPETHENIIRGFFSGNTDEIFKQASELSQKLNIKTSNKPIKKIIVYLDKNDFTSTWLGNKAIYKTRMVLADGGDLVIIAPGIKEFGENAEADHLIKKYGYTGTEHILNSVKSEKDLQNNLSIAAHLIHGSSEGRFNITYAPGHLTEEEIKSVNFKYCELDKAVKKYNLKQLRNGWNTLPNGEEIFFIDNPTISLWTEKTKFYR